MARDRSTNEAKAATPRVAVFHFANGNLIQRLAESGLEIAYFYDSDFGLEHVDFDDIPPFDLLAAELPGDQRKRTRALDLVLAFIRARFPASFLLEAGDSDVHALVTTVRERAEPLGYLTRGTEVGGNACVVGTTHDVSFDWPSSVASSTHPVGD